MGNCAQKPRKGKKSEYEKNKAKIIKEAAMLKTAQTIPDKTNHFPDIQEKDEQITLSKPAEESIGHNEEGITAFGDQNANSEKHPSPNHTMRDQMEQEPNCDSETCTDRTRNQSWMRYLPKPRPNGDLLMDGETPSLFGESWDPELFDQHRTPGTSHSPTEKDAPQVSSPQNRGKSLRKKHDKWDHWDSDESFEEQTAIRIKKNKFPVVSSNLLGFSYLPSDMEELTEWFRNGELENLQPNMNQYLIKGKRGQSRTDEQQNEEEQMGAGDSIGLKDSNFVRDGWLRYTMFLHQEQRDTLEFESKFRISKHTFLSLEARTNCELRISKRLYSYRGKLVRIMVMDGPTRKQILRCYSSLPSVIVKNIISQCERPGLFEPKPNMRLQSLNTDSPFMQQELVM